MAVESDLIFSPQANHNFSRILTDLKRSNLSISNRLRSIREDADFVNEVAHAYNRPLIANERCGSWYIAPEKKAGSAYFKSTDGHTGQWNFSSRRLNLHLLSIIGQHDGCIIVDSTRRGKQMPDALSKTVPIWCCVLNRVLFPAAEERHQLYTPPNVVSRSEHSQAEARILEHVAALKALSIDITAMRQHIQKPLRPMWVTQESQLIPTSHIFDDFHPVICCTSSRRVPGGEMSEGGYIQGAGDDTENWALGLTAPLFWNNAAILLATPESGLPDLVRSLTANQSVDPAVNTPIQVAPHLFVSRLPLPGRVSPCCTITFLPKTTDQSSWIKGPALMEVGIGKQKLASRHLRVALAGICDFVDAYLKRETGGSVPASAQKQILVACETGKDLSIGVVLALVCRFFDDEGRYKPWTPNSSGANKSMIKTKLGRIMLAFPEANPSRTTLQSVNSYLMG
ncbi:initiator tRNA phosphoribosyl transferase [Xylaria bambusicola]|uniref:initiator tRNA phosphoribosyl transferase n=1 Tax=Xylaria bambusicola TaxID=326684 RepID=UPI00200729DD|nr:initiator tRNA phosphoribosyl transferase [Xylaria bambusicola]KAI0525537.1 initiator tRNA phosphoribosyl transferase [Xylaria bambusicola]